MSLPRRVGRRFADARGFTMVELLVCVLIVGIMAAIALPAWLDQRAKGQDTEAKLALTTAATTLMTFESTEDTFAATRAQLEAIEPSLGEARDLTVNGTTVDFTLTVDSADGTEFSLNRDPTGKITRDCSQPGYGLCRRDLDGNLNRW